MTTQLTRQQLLKTKKQVKLATRGHSLLKKKRDSLIRKFFELVENYKELKKETILLLQKAYKELHKAEGVSGVNRLKSLSFSKELGFSLVAKNTNYMGVPITSYDLHLRKTGYNASTIGTSYYVEQTRKLFQKSLPNIVKLTEIEQVIYKLAEEIKKTKRRVNSLENIKIPGLQQRQRKIEQRLEEVERESFFRLKNVKKKIQEKNQ